MAGIVNKLFSGSLGSKIGLLSLFVGGGGLGFINSFLYTVDGGECAVIMDKIKGVQDEIRTEGTHFRIPYFQTPIFFDIRTTPKVITTETGSKDLQTVKVTLRVLYRPQLHRIKYLYQIYGVTYPEKILPSIGNEVLKSVVAQFDAGEIITQREHVSNNVRELLHKRAGEFGIIFDDVSITHVAFSDDYTRAIEQKQVAQQIAERQRFLVEKSRQEKEAEVILAEGETESAKLIMEAMKSGNEFLELRKIEAAKYIAKSLSTSRNIVYLPSGGNLLFNLSTPSASSSNNKQA
jgi:prohibitin 1